MKPKDIYAYLKSEVASFVRNRDISHRFPGTRIESHVMIKGPIENLRLGRRVIIQTGTVLHLGGMEWCHNQGLLEIGDDSVISPHCTLYGCGPDGIRIGTNFDCAPGVSIFASCSNFRSGSERHFFAPVVIGDHVIIFANAVISPGVTIGDYAVIAAGSVVTRDIPSDCLAGGTPAKVICYTIRERDGAKRNPLDFNI